MFLTVFDSDDFVYVSGIMELLAGIVMVFLEAPIIVQDINRNFAEVFKKSARAPFYTRGLLYLAFSLSPPMFYSGWLCVIPEIMITCVGVAYLVIGAVQLVLFESYWIWLFDLFSIFRIGDEQLQKNLNVASITEHVWSKFMH